MRQSDREGREREKRERQLRTSGNCLFAQSEREWGEGGRERDKREIGRQTDRDIERGRWRERDTHRAGGRKRERERELLLMAAYSRSSFQKQTPALSLIHI